MPTVPEEFYLPCGEFTPAYLTLGLTELRRRAEEGLEALRSGEVCPRDCRVNRLEDRYAVCKMPRGLETSPAKHALVLRGKVSGQQETSPSR